MEEEAQVVIIQELAISNMPGVGALLKDMKISTAVTLLGFSFFLVCGCAATMHPAFSRVKVFNLGTTSEFPASGDLIRFSATSKVTYYPESELLEAAKWALNEEGFWNIKAGLSGESDSPCWYFMFGVEKRMLLKPRSYIRDAYGRTVGTIDEPTPCDVLYLQVMHLPGAGLVFWTGDLELRILAPSVEMNLLVRRFIYDMKKGE